MKFIKRTTQPKQDNKYYGKPDPFINADLGMFQTGGNCTDYAWCRYRECQNNIKGSNKLPTSAAYRWYKDAKANGLETGSVAKLGAVAVFGKPDKKIGHVAVVEELNGIKCTYSSSAWNKDKKKRKLFYTKTLTQATKWGTNYPFIAYIYNINWDNDILPLGTYKTTKSKILRKTAKVDSNKLKVKQCSKDIKKLLTSKKPNDTAKFKVGVKVEFDKYTSDSKGNIWGRVVGNNTTTWICVCDSSGYQIK